MEDVTAVEGRENVEKAIFDAKIAGEKMWIVTCLNTSCRAATVMPCDPENAAVFLTGRPPWKWLYRTREDAQRGLQLIVSNINKLENKL